ncbi:MAG: OmpA family protein [Bacteroidota bacterium]
MRLKGFLLLLIFFPVKHLLAQPVDATFTTKVETTYEVKKLTGINSNWSEFSPFIFDNHLIFASDRDFDYLNWGENRWSKNKFLNVFQVEILNKQTDSVVFGKTSLFDDQLMHINHTGPLCVSPDGNEIYFTQVDKTKHTTNKPQLYVMKKNGTKWSEKQKLPFCVKENSFAHPALSSDGKLLFFASDKTNAGDKNIFYCTKQADGWSAPVEAGTDVNSPNDEVFPYFANGYLYFSSNRSGTTGGLDLYRVKWQGDAEKTPEPENLGSGINSPADDFGLVLTKDLKKGFFSSNRDGGEGGDDIYFVNIIEKVTVSKELIGKFTYRNLKGNAAGLEVVLLDSAGNVIMRTETDAEGNFVFRNLAPDASYTIRTLNNESGLNLQIIDREGKPVAYLLSDENGAFIYKLLQPELVGTFNLMEVEDTPLGKEGRVSGQFIYEKLPGQYPEGINVYLVDASGNIVQQTKTDKFGNFTFGKLPPDQNYIVKTDATGEDLILLIYNKSENVVAELRKNDSNEYVFRKLSSDVGSTLFVLETDDNSKLLPKHSITLVGRFKYKNMEGYPADMPFKLLDEAGNVIQRGKTDKNGNFRLKNLPVSDSYIFELEASDANFNKKLELQIFSRIGKPIAMLENDKSGRFVFRRLQAELATIETLSVNDAQLLERGAMVYFEKDKWELDAGSKKSLDRVAELMKKDKKLKIEIAGHTDSRQTDLHNDWLSERRMLSVRSYIISKGIAAGRIKGNYYGEKKLVNNCTDGVECGDDLHRANRRSEIKFIR